MKYEAVLQGECKVARDPEIIYSTVLGSCVAVCLFDETAKVGGMNHFLLPGLSGQSSDDLKYGVHSMELLINGVLKLGGSRNRLVAKMFGGSSVMSHHTHIGQSNQDFARDFLAREDIDCVAQSLGGNLARRVKFHPATGRARQVLIASNVPEDEITPTLPKPKVVPDISLF